MKKIKTAFALPLFWLLFKVSKDMHKIQVDGQAWCQWQHKNFTLWNMCSLFIGFKEFRNLFYYRIGYLHHLIEWIFPRMTNLYITTPRSDVDSGLIIQHGFATIISAKQIGKNCKIYPQVYLGDGVRLGDNVTLYPGVRIYEACVIGNNVTIHAGSVIGADGFGFAPDEKGEFHKIPQIGNVRIEDDVEIGANTCIDRATMGSTVIHKGVKLDNLIQIGHNVTVGANTVAASQVGVAGSSKVGAGCMLGGQVGIAGHLTVGDGVKLASKSGISNSIPDGETYMGNPAMPGIKYHRSHAVFRNLPDLSYKVRQLEKELEKLKAQLSAE